MQGFAVVGNNLAKNFKPTAGKKSNLRPESNVCVITE
jgi:hypothetical protein